jgi:hypothetical protein
MIIRAFSDGHYIFSVNMMIKYINNNKYNYKNISLQILLHNLYIKAWGNQINVDKRFAPMNIIKNPTISLLNSEIIQKSELIYPIIIYIFDKKLYIIDGYHRLSKAYLLNKKNIKAYIFTNNLLNKFKIAENNKKGWELVENLNDNIINEIYNEKFNKKNEINYKI